MDVGLPDSVDFALALGCCDVRVAERAADLVLEDRAELLVTSGGFGKISAAQWNEPEAYRFARVAHERGVHDSRILIEWRAANTGQNILYTKDLLQGSRIEPNTGQNITNTRDLLRGRSPRPSSGLLVCKPYMERRSLTTAEKQWPEVTWSVTSPNVGLEEYVTPEVPFHEMVALMVGDLQRIVVYPALGFQVPQDVPPEVLGAYEALVAAGYDRHLIDPIGPWWARRASSHAG